MAGAENKKSKMAADRVFPLLLLLAPLFSHPLVWKKIFLPNVPFWGDVQLFAPAVLGLLAAAALSFSAGSLLTLWRTVRMRWLMILALAGIATAAIQQFLYGGPPEFFCTSLFYFLLPVAGIIYSSELKRLFPLLGAVLFLPVLFVTLKSPDFSGWAGNWNWNFTLLAMTTSALFFAAPRPGRYKAALFAAVSVLLELTLFTLVKPEILPRGTFAGITGATICLFCFRNVPPGRRWAFALWAIVITLVLFAGSVGNLIEKSPDSRIQLWRGSLDFALAHLPAGTGADRFEYMINPYLPKLYYFTPFAAARHPHPHNEFLNFVASYGIAGGAFIILLIFLFLRGIRFRDRTGLWLSWCILLLGIHGQFDILLSLPLTGSWFLLGAGAVAGGGFKAVQPLKTRIPAAAGVILLLLCAFLGFSFWRSTSDLRDARLALAQNKKNAAAELLEKSIRCRPSAAALYTAGAVALYDFRNAERSIEYLEEIRDTLGLPMVYHSNALLGRAYAVKGDLAKSLVYLDEEKKYYPYSAVCSWLRLAVLRQAGAGANSIADESDRFVSLMKKRDLPPDGINKLIRNQDLDDAPLKKRKSL